MLDANMSVLGESGVHITYLFHTLTGAEYHIVYDYDRSYLPETFAISMFSNSFRSNFEALHLSYANVYLKKLAFLHHVEPTFSLLMSEAKKSCHWQLFEQTSDMKNLDFSREN